MITHEAEEQSNRISLRRIDVPLMANSLEISGDRSAARGGPSRFRTRRRYWLISAVLLLSVLAGWIPSSRRYILWSAGRLLVAQEPSIKSADIIVVAIDSILPNWCDENGYHSVLLVALTDHSRRLTRILRRSLRGRQLSMTVYSSRYSEFDPDTWWKTRAGVRTGIFELEKLLLDLVRHPFS